MVNTDNTLAETALTSRQRLRDNIKMNFKEEGRWGVDWFRLDGKNIDCRIFAKPVLTIWPSRKTGKLFTS
jgi:hypothetical protein